MRRPRWRLMTWIIFIWIALTLISAFRFAAEDQTCPSLGGLDRIACHLEARAGFRASVGWLVGGTIVLGIVWVITQPRQQPRECPACGSYVKRGVTSCPQCGHDFAAAARGTIPQPPPPANDPPPPPPPRPPAEE